MDCIFLYHSTVTGKEITKSEYNFRWFRIHLFTRQCLKVCLTLSWSECLKQPESLSWPECVNMPKYRGTFKLRTAKQCHQIMAIYFGSSHVTILKFHWQVSTFRNAGDFHGYNGVNCLVFFLVNLNSELHFRYCLSWSFRSEYIISQ